MRHLSELIIDIFLIIYFYINFYGIFKFQITKSKHLPSSKLLPDDVKKKIQARSPNRLHTNTAQIAL